MEFQYDEYFLNLFTIPIILIILGSFVVVGCMIDLIILNRLKFNKRFGRDIIIFVFFIALLVTGILQININIIKDDKNDFIELEGVIDSINSVSSPPRFHYNGEITMPKRIEINGKLYYIMYIEEFEVGDNVAITFLPNSYIVLSIYSSED